MEYTIPRIMMAAPASGSGKTTVTCALLHLLKKRGWNPCSFKCGPDYIDPMFHRQQLQVPSRNLDLFFVDGEQAKTELVRGAEGHSFAVLEGVMGLYDGIGMTDHASSWHLAVETNTPILLVVTPKGNALTLAAQIKGLLTFRQPSQVAGILLNQCSPSLAHLLTPVLEQETGVPVVGYLPNLPDCAIESRHLGLLLPQEVAGLEEKLEHLAQQMEQTVDVEQILQIACSAQPLEVSLPEQNRKPPCVSIAVAQDEAFSFYYAHNLERLEACGATLIPFSPVHDDKLPEGTDGLYLGGGYPELFAQQLSENTTMRQSIANHINGGLPTFAECGGFLYLQQSLQTPDGTAFPMVGVLDGHGIQTEKLQRFGYVTLELLEDTPYLKQGEQIRGHEFHRWDCTKTGDAAIAYKASGRGSWNCMVAHHQLLAGFPHLYFTESFAERFVAACIQYQRGTEHGITAHSPQHHSGQ